MSTVTTKDRTKVSDKDFGEGIAELSSRSGNGVDVALLWQQCDNTAIVVVVDHRNSEKFVLDVHENDNASTCSTTRTHMRRIDVSIRGGSHMAKTSGSRHEERSLAEPVVHSSLEGQSMKPMVSDKILWDAVVNELERDPEVVAKHISVTAIDGAITLAGHVVTNHETERAAAGRRRRADLVRSLSP
jgi:hypothetical protein